MTLLWVESLLTAGSDDQINIKHFFVHSLGAQLVKSLPSYIIKDYSTRNYRPDALDVGYEKVLLDGIGEIVDRYTCCFMV